LGVSASGSPHVPARTGNHEKEDEMGQATTRRTSSGPEAESTKEAVAATAGEVAETAKQEVMDVKDQAGERARSMVDSRSTEVGSQMTSAARAVRSASDELRQQGSTTAATVVEAVADRAQRLGSYMESTDADSLLRDAEDFARRRPWLVAGAAATVGLLASRLLKASSARRSESTNWATTMPRSAAGDGSTRVAVGGGTGVAA
jgi:ElaB/YqjD/DUF883 family membrane-anchored ribosome-binding protein